MAISEHPPHAFEAPTRLGVDGCVNIFQGSSGAEYVCGSHARADIHNTVLSELTEDEAADMLQTNLVDWQVAIVLALARGDNAHESIDELRLNNLRAFHMCLDLEFKRMDRYKALLGKTRDALNKAVRP